jgi:hypothetical protein
MTTALELEGSRALFQQGPDRALTRHMCFNSCQRSAGLVGRHDGDVRQQPATRLCNCSSRGLQRCIHQWQECEQRSGARALRALEGAGCDQHGGRSGDQPGFPAGACAERGGPPSILPPRARAQAGAAAVTHACVIPHAPTARCGRLPDIMGAGRWPGGTQGMVTNDVAPLEHAAAPPVYAVLMTPKGKYLHDMFVHRPPGAGAWVAAWAARAAAAGGVRTRGTRSPPACSFWLWAGPLGA